MIGNYVLYTVTNEFLGGFALPKGKFKAISPDFMAVIRSKHFNKWQKKRN